MKKFLAITLVMVLALLILTACGNNGNDSNVGNGDTTQQTQPPATNAPVQNQPGGTTPAPGNNTTTTPGTTPVPTTDPTPEPTPEPAAFTRILEATEFSDGVAWVLPYIEGVNTRNNPGSMHNQGTRANGVWWIGEEPHTPGTWYLVDRSGNTLLVSGEGESPVTPFSNGAGLIRRADGTVEMINKAGEVLSSPELGDYDEIISFLREYGAIVVRRQVNTWELTETQYGIIDSSGNWQIPLRGWDRSMGMYPAAINRYIGNGFYYNTRYHFRSMFNIFTGEAQNVTASGWETLRNFENGYGVFFQSQNIHVADINLNTNELFTGIISEPAVLGEYREGLFFMQTRSFTDGEPMRGFFDRDGNLVIDLRHLTIVVTASGIKPVACDKCVSKLGADFR